MHTMIEGYRKNGWQVYLLSMNTTRHQVDTSTLNGLFTNLAGFETVDVDNSLNWKDVARNFFFGKEPEHAQRFYSEAFRERLKEIIISFAPHVVQVESVYLTTYLPTVRKYSNAVTVLRMHNVEYQIWQGLSSKSRNIFKRYYLDNLATRVRNFERLAWREYDLLLAITERDAHLVQRLEKVNELLVAPFAIEVQSLATNTTPEKWVGYHLGAMDWRPNQDGIRWFLHKAWPAVRKAAPSFEFYFAGRAMSSELMQTELPGVYAMGEVPDADAFIADKKILIVPLWSGGGIRVKILEAMAAGKIVIATSKAIKGIEARPDEHYLRAHTPHDFAKAIKWCLEHRQEAEQIAANGRALIMDKYEQGKVSAMIDEVARRLVSARQ